MKLLLVEEDRSNERISLWHLAKQGHQIDCYLPNLPRYQNRDSPKFQGVEGFVDLAVDYQALILNAEAFKHHVEGTYLIEEYLQGLVSSEYESKIILTSDISLVEVVRDLRLREKIDHFFQKYFNMKELCGVLK